MPEYLVKTRDFLSAWLTWIGGYTVVSLLKDFVTSESRYSHDLVVEFLVFFVFAIPLGIGTYQNRRERLKLARER